MDSGILICEKGVFSKSATVNKKWQSDNVDSWICRNGSIFSSLVFWESISSTYPGLSPVACLSKLPQGAILEICETFDQSDDLAWPDTLFPNRETAMLSGSMLNTRNSLKYIRMKGEREVRVQLEGKYWTSNLSHLPQLHSSTAPTWRGTSPVPHSLHSILPAGSHLC